MNIHTPYRPPLKMCTGRTLQLRFGHLDVGIPPPGTGSFRLTGAHHVRPTSCSQLFAAIKTESGSKGNGLERSGPWMLENPALLSQSRTSSNV